MTETKMHGYNIENTVMLRKFRQTAEETGWVQREKLYGELFKVSFLMLNVTCCSLL
jgi:hypothetical protein